MPHTLIVGITESGKTTLAKILCAQYEKHRIKTLVLDTTYSDWPSKNVHRHMDGFMRECRESKSAAIFVDESGDNLDPHDRDHEWLATQSRHWGHNVHFIGQRLIQVPLTIRSNCVKLYCFTTTTLTDRETLADEFNTPEIRNAHLLPQFHFIMATRFARQGEKNEPLTGIVDWHKMKVTLTDRRLEHEQHTAE